MFVFISDIVLVYYWCLKQQQCITLSFSSFLWTEFDVLVWCSCSAQRFGGRKCEVTSAEDADWTSQSPCFCLLQGTIASSLTCVQLHKRAEKIAAILAERGHLQDGDHVALVYPPGKEERKGGVYVCRKGDLGRDPPPPILLVRSLEFSWMKENPHRHPSSTLLKSQLSLGCLFYAMCWTLKNSGGTYVTIFFKY